MFVRGKRVKTSSAMFFRGHDRLLQLLHVVQVRSSGKHVPLLDSIIMSTSTHCSKRILYNISLRHQGAFVVFSDKRNVRPRVWSAAICPRATLMDHDAWILHTRLIVFTVNNATPFRPVALTPRGQQICGFED